jgi:hypothetical protein
MFAIPLAYSAAGVLLGLVAFALALWALPKFLNQLTPEMDEEREILKGNLAVAIYFGLLVAAAVLGVALIIAAAIFAGIHE